MDFQIFPKCPAPAPQVIFGGPKKPEIPTFQPSAGRRIFPPAQRPARFARRAPRGAEKLASRKMPEKGLKNAHSARGNGQKRAKSAKKRPPQSRILLQVTLGAAPNVAEMHEKGLQNRPFGAKSATNTPKSRENDQQEAAES